MSELLTAREVQDLLKIDRTTVYRMLKDGRLTGIKVGQQWRFARQDVDALLAGGCVAAPAAPRPIDVLPLHCVQPIQDVFAEVAGVSAVTIGPDGEPLTSVSNPRRFWEALMATATGQSEHAAFWRSLALRPRAGAGFVTAPNGLQYCYAPISVDGAVVALLVAGQFYLTPPTAEDAARVQRLAARHGLDPAALAEDARDIPVLDPRARDQIGVWLARVAQTFETIARERAALLERLRRIADMTVLN